MDKRVAGQPLPDGRGSDWGFTFVHFCVAHPRLRMWAVATGARLDYAARRSEVPEREPMPLRGLLFQRYDAVRLGLRQRAFQRLLNLQVAGLPP